MSQVVVYASIDSYLGSGIAADANFGSVTYSYVGVTYSGGAKTGLLRAIGNFDVSALAGLPVTGVELHRVIDSVYSGGFGAHIGRCTRPSTWTEMGVTWNKYDGVNAWTAGGGDIDGALDFGYVEALSTGEHVISGLGALVDDALANRGGVVSVILRGDVDPGFTANVGFRSREGPSPWFLVVEVASSADPGRREAGERELAFDNQRGVRPRAGRLGVAPVGGVAPRRPLPASLRQAQDAVMEV